MWEWVNIGDVLPMGGYQGARSGLRRGRFGITKGSNRGWKGVQLGLERDPIGAAKGPDWDWDWGLG